jgi:hypothetical protein
MQGTGKPQVEDLICANTKPRFYRVEDPMHPTARNEPTAWIIKSAGRPTCPQDGSAVVTVSRNGRRVHLCLTCLDNAA